MEQINISHILHSRDVETIIDDSIWCTRKRRRPVPSTISPLQVVNVGSISAPIFHIGGLLPCKMLGSCTVITPGIALSATDRGFRWLSLKEIMDALDLTNDLMPASFNKKSLLHEHTIPGFSWVVAAMFFVDVGSDTVFDHNISPRVPKRLKLDFKNLLLWELIKWKCFRKLGI